MDINYHYFAAKVLAVKAGFGDDKGKGDAQLLAEYSQFVDDFDRFEPFFVEDVPEFARYRATNIRGSLYFFYPVTTGFNIFDYARLVLASYQKNILVPFHFMTKEPLDVVKKDRRDYRVEPVKNGGTAMLNKLLTKASDKYRQEASRENLIRIGALLHIFADSYAHQRFSGYWGWENNTYLGEVMDNVIQKDVTHKYRTWVYYYMPSIGHTNASTAPDDSYVNFEIHQKYQKSDRDPYPDDYYRSNPKEFLVASREILNYLRACLKKKPINDNDWNDLAGNLTKGFLTRDKQVDKLIKHWGGIFPDVSFHYDKGRLKEEALEENELAAVNARKAELDLPETAEFFPKKSNDYYLYNVIADSIRKTVNPPADEFTPAVGGDRE